MNEDVARGILGLQEGSSRQEIEQAYRRRATFMHPDRFAGRPEIDIQHATSEFQRLGQARDFLLAAGGVRADSQSSGESHSDRGQDHRSRKGRDHTVTTEISYDEAVAGAIIQIADPHGAPVKVRLPKAIDQSATVRIRGRGWPGTGGGDPGDLYAKFLVRHTNSQTGPAGRDRGSTSDSGTSEATRLDVHATALASPEQARRGDRVVFTSPAGGAMSVQLPAGVKSGEVLHLKGLGYPSPNGGRPGDLTVTVIVQGPKSEKPGGKVAPWLIGGIVFIILVALLSTMNGDMSRSSSESVDTAADNSRLAFTYERNAGECQLHEGFGCWIWDVTPSMNCASAEITVDLFDSEEASVPVGQLVYIMSGLKGQEIASLEVAAEEGMPDFADLNPEAICTRGD